MTVDTPAAIPPAESKVGFFQRLWQRLIGAVASESAAASPPPVRSNAETPAKITVTREEAKAKPLPSEPPVIEPVPVLVRPDKTAVIEVLRIESSKGGVYYVRQDEWENRADRTDVPLCDAAGQAVQTGQRARLRVSTILTCKLVPVGTPTIARASTTADVSQYLPLPADDSPENLTM